MPTCGCPDVEIRTGNIEIYNDVDTIDLGRVQLVNYGRLLEKHPIINPVYNVVECVKEYVNGLYIVATLDCSAYEVLGTLLGVTPQSIGGALGNFVADTPFGPVYIENAVTVLENLGSIYRPPYGTLAFGATGAVVVFSSDIGGADVLVEGTEFEFTEVDGVFTVNTNDPVIAIDTQVIYIQSGDYTTAASERYRFDECAIDTSMRVTYTHPMQDNCPSTNDFVVHLPDAYIAEAIDITDAPGEPRLYTVRWESIWHGASVGYEVGYWSFGTA